MNGDCPKTQKRHMKDDHVKGGPEQEEGTRKMSESKVTQKFLRKTVIARRRMINLSRTADISNLYQNIYSSFHR